MLRAPCQLFTRLGDLFVVWLSVRGRQWVVTVASSGKPKETEEILRKKNRFFLASSPYTIFYNTERPTALKVDEDFILKDRKTILAVTRC
jgi:hypothetical protein